jgi:hypothetical protein
MVGTATISCAICHIWPVPGELRGIMPDHAARGKVNMTASWGMARFMQVCKGWRQLKLRHARASVRPEEVR